jgi:hypothetical protein
MRVALLTTFKASKKEPLAALLERIHAAFLASGHAQPSVQFSLADAPLPGFVSSVDRVLKRHPQLERFTSSFAGLLGAAAVRQISNAPGSPAAGQPIEFATLLAIAQGVPRSFPFHSISIQFHAPAFGEALQQNAPPGSMTPGVMVGDSWWVNGRTRSLGGWTIVDADLSSQRLPALPGSVAAIFAACGTVKNTVQMPLAGSTGPATAAPNPEVAAAVRAVVLDYRTRFDEILGRATLPHDLPPALEALKAPALGQATGPKKPVLVQAFKPLGYDCRGESGTFTLRRRTAGHLTVEISLDVGTWSRSLTAFFKVQGLGFRAVLPLPASRRAAGGGQYPIGEADRWQQLVDNLAALVAELDRTFVPAVEAASGPSPEWYSPES